MNNFSLLIIYFNIFSLPNSIFSFFYLYLTPLIILFFLLLSSFCLLVCFFPLLLILSGVKCVLCFDITELLPEYFVSLSINLKAFNFTKTDEFKSFLLREVKTSKMKSTPTILENSSVKYFKLHVKPTGR
jgi:hypothetical protein